MFTEKQTSLVGYLTILALALFTAQGFSQNNNPFYDKLEKLQQENNFEEWIYSRIEFCTEAPSERLNFLMLTQNNSWRKPKTASEKEAWLNLLVNQGYYQLYCGNVLLSIEQYEQAYSFYLRHPVKDFDLVEYLLKPLGNNYTRLGDYSRALFIQQKSLDMVLRQKDSSTIAAVYNNLAITYKSLGETQKAENACLSGFRFVHSNQSRYGLLKNTLADIYTDQGKLKDAFREVREAIRVLSKTSSQSSAYWLLSSFTLAGNIAQLTGQYKEALSYYGKSIFIIDTKFKGGRLREKANLLNQCGKSSLALQHADLALNFYNKALKLLLKKNSQGKIDSIYGENRLYDAFEGKGKLLLEKGNYEEALHHFTLALQVGDQSRNEYAGATDKVFYQKEAKKLAELAIKTAYQMWLSSRKEKYANIILNLAEKTKARTLADQIEKNRSFALLSQKDPLVKKQADYERAIVYYEKEALINPSQQKTLLGSKREIEYKLSLLNRTLKEKYPAWKPSHTFSGTALKTSLTLLPQNTTVVEFFCGEDDVYSITLTKGKAAQIQQISNAAKIRSNITTFIQTYFKEGASAMTNHPKDFFEDSYSLYKSLWGENQESLRNNNLIIIPDEKIGLIPFDALITSPIYSSSIKNWHFLINKHIISYAYSLTTLFEPEADTKTARPVNFEGFFISSTAKESEIPAVKLEAEKIQKQVKGNFFLNKDASAKNFRKALSKADVLHISTHSFMYGKQQEPTLQLADQKFFLLELTAQSHAPDLVVLSACRTADGILASGEGILSLSRGFTAAGTNGIISGFWNVNDETGAEIISVFYENLQKGESTAAALHLAKKKWLQSEHENSSLVLPYYWASLVYIGKPQVLRIEEAGSSEGLIVLISTLAVAILLWKIYKIRKKRAD